MTQPHAVYSCSETTVDITCGRPSNYAYSPLHRTTINPNPNAEFCMFWCPPPRIFFFFGGGALGRGPRILGSGACPLKFANALEIDQGFLAHTTLETGLPVTIFENKHLKIGLKFNPLNCLLSRTYGAGWSHVGLCPRFLVFF